MGTQKRLPEIHLNMMRSTDHIPAGIQEQDLGVGLTDRVIDAATFSQNRRRFVGTDIKQTIFDQVVEQAIEHIWLAGVSSTPANLHSSVPYRDQPNPHAPTFRL